MTQKKVTVKDVLLFYPNLIGYARILLMILSFYLSHRNWIISVSFYLLAFGGDVIDGYVARKYDQTSIFGGILDMVTDRVSTCGLLAILSQLYTSYAFTLLMLIVLDISSHWFHVMSVSGHHKSKESLEKRNWILKSYYAIYPLFGYCCVGTEFFFILMYILHFYQHPFLRMVCFYGCMPACVIKQIVNVAQLMSAIEHIAMADANRFNQADE